MQRRDGGSRNPSKAVGEEELPEGASKQGWRGLFWKRLRCYAVMGLFATSSSAISCPVGTDEDWAERGAHYGKSCGATFFPSLFSLLFLLKALDVVHSELEAVDRAAQRLVGQRIARRTRRAQVGLR